MSLDARVVHILHDEIIVEAKDDIAGQVEEIVKESMEGAFEQLKLGVPMIAKPKRREAWGLIPTLSNSFFTGQSAQLNTSIYIQQKPLVF